MLALLSGLIRKGEAGESSEPPSPKRRPGIIVGLDGGTTTYDRDGTPLSQAGGVPLTDRTRNPVIATGPMGSGKTQGFYATLMDPDYGYTHSAVLWDYKRVMAGEVGKAREMLGNDVVVVDITRRGSGRVNPLQWVRQGDEFCGDIQLIATKITDREKNGDGKAAHWINATYSYMVGVIAYLLTAAPDSEKNLAGVRRHMMRGDAASREMMRDGIDELASEAAQELWSKSLEWEPDEDDEIEEGEDKSAFYRKSIYTTASAMLADFADKVVAEQTATSDFDPSDLVARERPLTVILSTNPPTARRLRRVYGLIFTQIVDRLTEDIKRVCGLPRTWDVLLGIDEFLEFKIEEVSSWVKYVREFGVRPYFLAQTFEDVIGMYGRVMNSSAVWVAYAPMSVFEAELMSKLIGERYQVVESESKTKRYWYESASVTESTRLEWRPEKTPSDLMDMGRDELYVFGLGKAIAANRVLAFSRYRDRYGPASRNWTSPVDSNPWFGKAVPLPAKAARKSKKPKVTTPATPKKTKEAAAGKEGGTESGNASVSTKSLLRSIRK